MSTRKKKQTKVSTETNDKKTWFFKGKSFKELSDKFYNLSSGRFVKNKPRICDYSINKINIIGTRKDTELFFEENRKSILERFKTKKPDYVRPFNDITYICKFAVNSSLACKTDYKTTITGKNTELEDLSDKYLEEMSLFGFEGMFLKARVTRVIDADTLIVVVCVPVNDLGKSRKIGKNGMLKRSCLFKTRSTVKFFTKLKIRMWGYDAAEKDTKAGKLAKSLYEEKIQSLKNIIWMDILDKNIVGEDGGKFGRVLAVLYEDEKRTKPLTDYLIRMEKSTGVKMIQPFFGGTKKSFS